MSGISISPYFPFRRLQIAKQAVDAAATKAEIDVVPDQRFQPVCHLCRNKAPTVHSWTQRSVRDLNLASTQVWLCCEYRKLLCAHCQRISIEELEIFHPYLRVTRRLAAEIHKLCKVMTVTDVALHFQLDWKTVKDIDKQYLEAHYGQPNLNGLRILAVDEISIRIGEEPSLIPGAESRLWPRPCHNPPLSSHGRPYSARDCAPGLPKPTIPISYRCFGC